MPDSSLSWLAGGTHLTQVDVQSLESNLLRPQCLHGIKLRCMPGRD